MAPTFPFTGLDAVEVFAVEDRTAQLVWRDLPRGEVGVIVDGRSRAVGEGGGPGATEIDGLEPSTTNSIDVTLDGSVVSRQTAHTTAPLDGPAQVRIATISDLHLGEIGFGLVKEMKEHADTNPGYPLRCALAAVAEATAWGAELLVIKGDITEHGRPEHWEQFDHLLAATKIPVVAIPGNHDTFAKPGSLDATEALHARGLFPEPVQTRDLAGVRIVVADTTTPRHTWGRIHHIADALEEAVDTDLPTLLFLHHHLETHLYPRVWPLGTPKREAGAALDRLVETNPDLLISSGHTHRNRARRHGTAIISEVGATKDHPGVWAGYVAHAGGVRQVVRRVAEPSCLAWNDRTHAVLGGIWGKWSPGRITDRSFVHPWTSRRRPAVQSSETSSVRV